MKGKWTSAPNSCTLISPILVLAGSVFPAPSRPSQKTVLVPILQFPVIVLVGKAPSISILYVPERLESKPI